MKYRIDKKKVLQDFIYIMVMNKTIMKMSDGVDIIIDDADFDDFLHDILLLFYRLMEKHAKVV